ncbi:MAG: hypothetical protein WAN86_24990 [Hyphomicrobiaceae bacterium]
MRKGRQETERDYPPDYVSAETLAYRLDCEVEALMRKGALPRPRMIGDLRRWDFASVRAFVERRTRRPNAWHRMGGLVPRTILSLRR